MVSFYPESPNLPTHNQLQFIMTKIPDFCRLWEIIQAGKIDARAFEAMHSDPTQRLQLASQFREKVETILRSLDERWLAAYNSDSIRLAEWTGRMIVVRRRIQILDLQLQNFGGARFQWDNVFDDMGFLNAFCAATERALKDNDAVLA